jgi:hypothetical protein
MHCRLIPTYAENKMLKQFTSVLIPVDVATAHAPPKYETIASQNRRHMPEDGLPEYRVGRGYGGPPVNNHIEGLG